MGNVGLIRVLIGHHDKDALVLLSRGSRVGGGILELLRRWHARVHSEVVVLRLLLQSRRHQAVTSWGYIILDDEDAPVLLRRGIRVDCEILNICWGHVRVHSGELVDPLPLGGHIVVGDRATVLLLLLLAGPPESMARSWWCSSSGCLGGW
jgi:hypothetical protein